MKIKKLLKKIKYLETMGYTISYICNKKDNWLPRMIIKENDKETTFDGKKCILEKIKEILIKENFPKNPLFYPNMNINDFLIFKIEKKINKINELNKQQLEGRTDIEFYDSNKNINRTQIEDLKANVFLQEPIGNIQQKMNINFTNTKKLFFDKDNNLISNLDNYFDENGNLIPNKNLSMKCVQMGKSESDTIVNIIKDIIDSSQELKRYDIYIYDGSTSDDFYFCVI